MSCHQVCIFDKVYQFIKDEVEQPFRPTQKQRMGWPNVHLLQYEHCESISNKCLDSWESDVDSDMAFVRIRVFTWLSNVETLHVFQIHSMLCDCSCCQPCQNRSIWKFSTHMAVDLLTGHHCSGAKLTAHTWTQGQKEHNLLKLFWKLHH